jgi:hypothetical protein
MKEAANVLNARSKVLSDLLERNVQLQGEIETADKELAKSKKTHENSVSTKQGFDASHKQLQEQIE